MWGGIFCHTQSRKLCVFGVLFCAAISYQKRTTHSSSCFDDVARCGENCCVAAGAYANIALCIILAVAVLSSLKVHISSSHHHRTAYATTHTHTCDIHIYRLIASSAQALSINNMKYTRVHIARARTSPRHRRLRSSSAVVRQRPSQSTHSHVVALVPSQQQPRTLPTTLHTVGRNSPIRKSVVEEKRKTITMAIELYLE